MSAGTFFEGTGKTCVRFGTGAIALAALAAGSPPAAAVCKVLLPSGDGGAGAAPVVPAGDQPVLVREWPGTWPGFVPRQSMVVGPAFLSASGEFGLVVPVPKEPLVRLAPSNLFATLSASAKPLVVTTVVEIEDPSMGEQCSDPKFSSTDRMKWTSNDGWSDEEVEDRVVQGGGGGCGGGGGGFGSPDWADPPSGTGIRGGTSLLEDRVQEPEPAPSMGDPPQRDDPALSEQEVVPASPPAIAFPDGGFGWSGAAMLEALGRHGRECFRRDGDVLCPCDAHAAGEARAAALVIPYDGTPPAVVALGHQTDPHRDVDSSHGDSATRHDHDPHDFGSGDRHDSRPRHDGGALDPRSVEEARRLPSCESLLAKALAGGQVEVEESTENPGSEPAGGGGTEVETEDVGEDEPEEDTTFLDGHAILGNYEVAVLDGSAPGAFTDWLVENGFGISRADREVLESYGEEGWWFVAVRVTEVQDGVGFQVLQPLEITFDIGAEGLVLPGRIGWNPDGPSATFDVWAIGETALVLPDAKVDFAGLPDRTTSAMKTYANAGEILTHFLFDLDEMPPLAIEIAALSPDYRVQEVIEETQFVKVPVTTCTPPPPAEWTPAPAKPRERDDCRGGRIDGFSIQWLAGWLAAVVLARRRARRA